MRMSFKTPACALTVSTILLGFATTGHAAAASHLGEGSAESISIEDIDAHPPDPESLALGICYCKCLFDRDSLHGGVRLYPDPETAGLPSSEVESKFPLDFGEVISSAECSAQEKKSCSGYRPPGSGPKESGLYACGFISLPIPVPLPGLDAPGTSTEVQSPDADFDREISGEQLSN